MWRFYRDLCSFSLQLIDNCLCTLLFGVVGVVSFDSITDCQRQLGKVIRKFISRLNLPMSFRITFVALHFFLKEKPLVWNVSASTMSWSYILASMLVGVKGPFMSSDAASRTCFGSWVFSTNGFLFDFPTTHWIELGLWFDTSFSRLLSMKALRADMLLWILAVVLSWRGSVVGEARCVLVPLTLRV